MRSLIQVVRMLRSVTSGFLPGCDARLDDQVHVEPSRHQAPLRNLERDRYSEPQSMFPELVSIPPRRERFLCSVY